MSQRKCASCSGPLPDISTASIHQLSAMPAEVLHLHLANYHLITTDTKITMACQLFDAIHSASSATTTPTTIPGMSSATPLPPYPCKDAHLRITTIRINPTNCNIWGFHSSTAVYNFTPSIISSASRPFSANVTLIKSGHTIIHLLTTGNSHIIFQQS